MEQAKKLVALGYDRIAERCEVWGAGVRVEECQRYIRLLLDSLPNGSPVLDLGCATGLLVTKPSAERFQVTGLDISERQIRLVRRNVPSAQFVCGEMTTAAFRPGSFDGVAAFYSIVHVPRAEHRLLFSRIFSWLRPGGFLLAPLGLGDKEIDHQHDWLGVPMFWSSFDAPSARAAIADAGFRIISLAEETADEDGVPVPFLWIQAKRPD